MKKGYKKRNWRNPALRHAFVHGKRKKGVCVYRLPRDNQTALSIYMTYPLPPRGPTFAKCYIYWLPLSKTSAYLLRFDMSG